MVDIPVLKTNFWGASFYLLRFDRGRMVVVKLGSVASLWLVTLVGYFLVVFVTIQVAKRKADWSAGVPTEELLGSHRSNFEIRYPALVRVVVRDVGSITVLSDAGLYKFTLMHKKRLRHYAEGLKPLLADKLKVPE